MLGNGWVELAGDLNITSFHLANAAVAGDHIAAQPSLVGSTQTVAADFTSAGNNGAPIFGLLLRCQDCGTAGVAPTNYYRIYRATGGSSLLKISKVVSGAETVLKTVSIANPAANVQFHFLATASGTTLTVAVGATQTSVTDATFASGSVGILIRSGGGTTPIHQADNFQATVSGGSFPFRRAPAGTISPTIPAVVEVSSRAREDQSGVEDTQFAATEERRPVERVASLGFPFTTDRDFGVGLSLCSIRLLGGDLVGPTDSGGTLKAFGDVGSASVVGTGASLKAVKGTAKPTGVSAVGHRYFFYSPEMSLVAETEIRTDTSRPEVLYEYIWFNGHPVAQVDAGTATHWTFTDHLGTPIIQTDDSGTITWRGEHEPYGKVFTLRSGDGEHQPLRLPGQEAEQFNLGPNGATERSYNIFRWYRQAWSRYTQPDPLSKDLPAWQDSRLSGSLFGYAALNPLVFVDRNGLETSAGACCACPQGTWSYSGVSSGASFLIGYVDFHGTYTCASNPSLKVKVDGHCWSGGLQAGFGVSFDFSLASLLLPGAKGCNVTDLFKTSVSVFASGELGVGVGATGDLQNSTGSVGVGFGAGAGFGAQKCWTRPYKPIVPVPGQ